jgi:GNAT superfamily N-acetyltransferase
VPTIRPVCPSDWDPFYSLASAEGWRVPQSERHLFQTDWSRYVQVLEVDGCFAGLVTAVPHVSSGWIGNLIVAPSLRGKGYGGRLFQAARTALADRNIVTVWLTASEQGRPIYERCGFVHVDRIERWVLPAAETSLISSTLMTNDRDLLLNADQSAWSEVRRTLLSRLLCCGQVVVSGDAVALLQKGADLQIIGPWYSEHCDVQTNRSLLQQLIATADAGVDLVVDLLTSSQLQSLFPDAGFQSVGEAGLMAHGDIDRANLSKMISLASLGSIG